MSHARRIRTATGLLVATLALGLAACNTGARAGRGADPAPEAGAPASPGEVVLTDQDLAPMDAFVRRRRWILGDDVDVVASREYFASLLSITERIGSVRREDSIAGGDTLTVLTYDGPPDTIDVQTAPRVLIGTGLSVMARRRLSVRLAKTTDANLPVRLDVAARGRASTGASSQVVQRSDALSIHAALRRGPAGGYLFEGT